MFVTTGWMTLRDAYALYGLLAREVQVTTERCDCLEAGSVQTHLLEERPRLLVQPGLRPGAAEGRLNDLHRLASVSVATSVR